MELLKIHSHEDKSTLRICDEHYLLMTTKPREWDLWVAVAFPKWDKKVYHRDREAFLAEAKHFIKLERTINKELENGCPDGWKKYATKRYAKKVMSIMEEKK